MNVIDKVEREVKSDKEEAERITRLIAKLVIFTVVVI